MSQRLLAQTRENLAGALWFYIAQSSDFGRDFVDQVASGAGCASNNASLHRHVAALNAISGQGAKGS